MSWWQAVRTAIFGQEKAKNDKEKIGKFLEGFSGRGRRAQIDIEPYVRRFAKEGFDPMAMPTYSIVMFQNGLKDRPADFDRMCFDADYNLVLVAPAGLWSGNPAIACIGFSVEMENGAKVIIRQLQAVSQEMLARTHGEFHVFTKESLKPIKWERMLVAILLDLVFDNGFESVEMIRAEESKWYSQPYTQQSSAADVRGRMKIRYDVTAKRMGFAEKEKRFVMTKERHESRVCKNTDK